MQKLETIKTICCDPKVWARNLEHAKNFFAAKAEKENKIVAGSIWDFLESGADLTVDIYGDAIPQPVIVGDAAVIPVCGILANGLPTIFKALGYIDPEDIIDDLDEAMADESVKSIWSLVDSPGGSVEMIPELAKKIADIQAGGEKPIYVYAKSCYSAAMWICAGANAIVARGSGGIGSVGCYTVFADEKGFWEKMGITFKMFSSGDYKGAGADGTLTQKQAVELQNEVDAIAGDFKSFLKSFRSVADEDLHGQCFSGIDGAARGFCDGTADSLESAMKLFAK